MDEYVKSLKLKLQAEFDQSKLDDVKREFKDLESVKLGLLSDEEVSKMEKAFTEMQKKTFEIQKLKQAISEVEMFGGDEKTLSALQQQLEELQGKSEGESEESFVGGFKEAAQEWLDENSSLTQAGKRAFSKMQDTLKSWASKALASIKQFVSDAIDEMKNMASWSSSSYIYNRSAAEMRMQYGLEGAQAYGMSKALETQGFSSIDDFLQAYPMMSKEQLEYMKDVAKMSEASYENDIESAKQIQEFSKEYDELKRELQTEVIGFISDNKSLIKAFMEGTITLLEAAVKTLGGIFSLFGGTSYRSQSAKMQTTADILSSSSNVSNYKNVSISNTYNGVSRQDQSWLANSGQMTYQQIVQALR